VAVGYRNARSGADRRGWSPGSDWRRSCWATAGPVTWPPDGCSAEP